MYQHLTRLLLVLILLSGAGLAYAGQGSGAAPEAAKTCFDCHGDKGVSQHKQIPTIAGMSAFYLEGQMEAYKAGQRPCEKVKYQYGDTSRPETDMCDIAKKLSKEDVTTVTEYFAGEKFVAASQVFDAKKAAVGKQIHELDCEKCHSEGGSLPDDDAGILAGQWMPYLQHALTAYKNGKRVEPEKMKPKTDALTPDQIDDLVNYYASEKSGG